MVSRINSCDVQIEKNDFIIKIPKSLAERVLIKNGELILFDKVRNEIHLKRNDNWCN